MLLPVDQERAPHSLGSPDGQDRRPNGCWGGAIGIKAFMIVTKAHPNCKGSLWAPEWSTEGGGGPTVDNSMASPIES